jgi:hypothetical protein
MYQGSMDPSLPHVSSAQQNIVAEQFWIPTKKRTPCFISLYNWSTRNYPMVRRGLIRSSGFLIKWGAQELLRVPSERAPKAYCNPFSNTP